MREPHAHRPGMFRSWREAALRLTAAAAIGLSLWGLAIVVIVMLAPDP